MTTVVPLTDEKIGQVGSLPWDCNPARAWWR